MSDNSFCGRCGKLLRPSEGRTVWIDTGSAIIACDGCSKGIYHHRIEEAATAFFGGKNPFNHGELTKTGLPLFDNYNNDKDLWQ